MKILIITQSFMIKQALLHLFEINFNTSSIIFEEDITPTNFSIEDIDLVIYDCNENNEKKLESISEIRNNKGGFKLVVLDNNKNERLCTKSIKMGIDGYITEISSEDEFLYIMKKILAGSKYFDGQAVQQALNHNVLKRNELLTNRENEVLNLVSKGLNNREISLNLNVSECTVKKHVSNILEKLNFKNRQEIIIYVKECGEVS